MTPRKGDKVRVTYEAEYDSDYNGSAPRYGHLVTVAGHRAGSTGDRFTCAVPNDATVEVIEDLRPGDVYRTLGGRAYVYVGEHPRYDHEWIFLSPGRDFSLWRTGTPIADKEVMRPLTLLVRDGKPVTP